VNLIADLTRQRHAHDAYLCACELELRAYKPGNVSLHSAGHDMTVEDFRRSATVSAPYLSHPESGLGETIFRAIEATHRAVGCNTNLGIVLLCAPLMQAFLSPDREPTLHETLRKILQKTTVIDADWVYRAIRLAQPAGLGKATEEDVRGIPQVTLLNAMRLAAARDSVARQYSDSFGDVFDIAVPLYHDKLSLWDDEEWAALAVFLGLLIRYPDSHVERKFGAACARQVTQRMVETEALLSACTSPQNILGHLREADREFKSRGINPGTTADLTVATILAAKLASLY
jgi:triphosphoribosyl-dephospho-CoA synthase